MSKARLMDGLRKHDVLQQSGNPDLRVCNRK